MKKLKNVLKSSKTTKLLAASILLIQFCSIILLVGCLYQSRQIKENRCETETIVIEEKNIIRSFREMKCCVSYQDTQFVFPNLVEFGLSPNDLYNELEVGSSLEVLYTENVDFFGKRLLIVEAKGRDNFIFQLDEYNSSRKKAFVLFIVFFCLFEIINVGIVFAVIFLYKNELKVFIKKLKRLKNSN